MQPPPPTTHRPAPAAGQRPPPAAGQRSRAPHLPRSPRALGGDEPSRSARARATLALLTTLALLCACQAQRGAPTAGPPDRASGARPQPAPPAATLAQLSPHITPRHYDLELDIDPRDDIYRGRVSISLDLTAATSSIVLHSKDLIIEDPPVVVVASGEEGAANTIAATVHRDPALTAAELIRIDLDRPLGPGSATLGLAFSGSYGQDVGIFRQERDGEHYVYSDFEPIDARRGFPCFDEPRFKTTWSISLRVPPNTTGLSNMPQTSATQLASNRTLLRFETTPPLPTYLVAIAAGRFELVDVPGAHVPMRIITPAGQSARAVGAVKIAPPLLDRVREYVAAEVPFPKLDLIAVPRFSGAMENPGLITVGEHILLADPVAPAIAQQRLLAVVAAHEFAHLWFGDSLTPHAWRELWLNEGISNWLTSKVLQRWRPDRRLDLEAVTARHDAMAVDAQRSARAVRAPVSGRDQLGEIFDAITYRKGSALVAMFEAWIGAEPFQRALRAYVAAHHYGNVTTDDLIAALARESSLPLAPVLESFLGQPGYPVVHAELSCGAAPDAGASTPPAPDAEVYVTLSQRRYLTMHEHKRATTSERAASWQVPVCLRYDTGAGQSAETCQLLDATSARVALATSACPAWVVPNAHAVGYYHYSMPAPALRALASAPLSGAEATDLARQLRPLLASGDLSAAAAADIADALSTRPERHVNEALIALHQALLDMLPEAERGRYRARLRRRYTPRARAVGWTTRPGESEEETLLRPTLLHAAGYLGRAPELTAEARRRTDRWLKSDRGIPPGVIETTLHIAAASGDAALFKRMLDALSRAKTQARAHLLARALGSSSNPLLIDRALAQLSNKHLDVDTRQVLLMRLLERSTTVAPALSYLREHSLELSETNDGRLLLLSVLFGAGLCGPHDLTHAGALSTYAAMRGEIPIASLEPWLARADLRARQCERLRDEHREPLREALRAAPR